MKPDKKVLAIALDAAEPSLIEKWMDEGILKNLALIRSKGSYGRLSSSAEWLVGSPWPTFYTGTLPNKHGIYHYLQWRSDKMDYERPNPDWINAVPFWRQLGKGSRVIAVDMPLAFPPDPFSGIEISGWASHDRIFPPFSYPPEKIKWVIKKFGKPPVSDEVGGLQKMSGLKKVKEELIHAAEKETELILELIRNEKWNLLLCCLTSPHRGGHKFWDMTNIKGNYSEKDKILFKNYLRDIYISCDEAVGEIIRNAGENVDVLVFSLHGMGVNTTLTDKMLPSMISNILNGKKGSTENGNSGFVKKIRNFIPLGLRSNLRKLLPVSLQDKMTAYWRMGNKDWSKTKAFNLVADLQGYIRINLKGREQKGSVEPGQEYKHLCDRLKDGLLTFNDPETKEPVIKNIRKKEDLFIKGKGFDNLPDLLVQWKNKPASSYAKITSEQFGEVYWPMPGLNPDGRSGNHRPEGFLLTAGKNIKINSSIQNKHIIDLAPTIVNLLGAEIPKGFDGEVIEEIIKRE
ncbi:MAG TPA: alkaline phosphatase family protein [Ignavibacteriaceae bacterium]|nr:alkaline phosphatase family protein [Ignavibacteriaceae bacterium]